MVKRVFFSLYTVPILLYFFFFFFNDTATTEIYTLSLHDALPIYSWGLVVARPPATDAANGRWPDRQERQSNFAIAATCMNSSGAGYRQTAAALACCADGCR